MSALVLQAQANAGPGHMEAWARTRGVALDRVRVREAFTLPDAADHEAVVVLGSQASLAGTAPAWVARELSLIRDADAAGVPVLGICFGAQALAVVLGGRVTRLPVPEIGWIEVDTDDPDVVGPGPWMAWHEDVIELPLGVVELARNPIGPQAFAHGPHLGVQFHPEATPAIIEGWVGDGLGHELAAEHAATVLDGATGAPAQRAAAAFDRLLDAFMARVRAAD